MSKSDSEIILYTSNFCGQAWAVESFMRKHKIPVKLVNIDRDPDARQEVMALNNGYASVPTLVFPNGEKLTEPSLGELRAKLQLNSPGILQRIRDFFGNEPE